MKKVKILFLVIIMFGLTLAIYNFAGTSQENVDSTNKILSSTSYTVHAPIVVSNNSAFTLVGFTGTGTSQDPYILSNYNFTCSNTSCITISNTQAYFKIENNYFENYDYAISILSSNNGVIDNNVVIGNGMGLFLNKIQNMTISNNNMSLSWSCMELSGATNVSISNNIFQHSYNISSIPSCLDIQGVPNVRINNNTFSDYLIYGISLSQSPYSLISNNTLLNSPMIINSNNCTITSNNVVRNDLAMFDPSNVFEKDGILLSASNATITKNNLIQTSFDISPNIKNLSIDGSNLVNNKAVKLVLNESNSIITGNYGQVVVMYSNNITVENINIEQTEIGIELVQVKNVTVTNSNFENNSIGIYEQYSSPSQNLLENDTLGNNSIGIYSTYNSLTIKNNTIKNNLYYGIDSQDDVYLNITTNKILNNGEHIPPNNYYQGVGGVYAYYTSYLSIKDNNIDNNLDGINLQDNSQLTYIENNTIVGNHLNGINGYIFSGYINNNNLSYNYRNGILLINLENSEINNNTLIGNNGYGIANRVDGSAYGTYYDILFQFNLFYSNRENLGSQAYDGSYTNPIWIHNYWSNFTGYDQNSDGFYDNPYVIDGPAGSNDPSALVNSPLGNVTYPVFTTFTPQTVTEIITSTVTTTSTVPTTITNQNTVTENNAYNSTNSSNISTNSSNSSSNQNSSHATEGFGTVLILVSLTSIMVFRKRKIKR